MDCPPGFTLKRKRDKKDSSTGTSQTEEGEEAWHGVGRGLNAGVHKKIKPGYTKVRGFYPVKPPSIVPPVIKNVSRKDLAVPAIHSPLFSSGPSDMPRPGPGVKKEVPAVESDQCEGSAPQFRIPKSPGKKSPSTAIPLPANP